MLALASAAALSSLLEAAQSYLPARFASNLDVICNVAGAALGAALGPALRAAGSPRARCSGGARSAFLPGAAVDFGLVLVGLWLFIQLNPATLLFGAGDLRDFLGAAGKAARGGRNSSSRSRPSPPPPTWSPSALLLSVLRRAGLAGARACSAGW